MTGIPALPKGVRRRTFYANVYLLDSPDGRLVVDAGVWPSVPYFARLLRDFQPDALLLTHHHVDHAGGAFIAARLGVPVLAHPLEHRFLTGAQHALPSPAGWPGLGRTVSRLHPKVPQDALRGVRLAEKVYGWEVVALPGHTPGQIGLLRHGVLIAGDAVVSGKAGAHLPRAVYNDDHRAAVQTLQRIAGMDLKVVLPGHGVPLMPEQVQRRSRRSPAQG